jgi:hypothetical protein
VGTAKSFELLVAIGVAALDASLLVLVAAVEPAQATFPGKMAGLLTNRPVVTPRFTRYRYVVVRPPA